LEALKEIEPLKERLGAADAQANAIRVAADRLAALEDHARRLAAARTCSSAAAARLRVTAGLPDPAVLTRLHDQLERGRAHDELAEKLRRTTAALALARARDALLADLPDSVPVPESTTAAEETLGRLRSVGEQAAAMRHRLTGLDQRMNTVRADLARLMDETGGRCPTCGSPVDSDALLTGHAHPGQEAA
jgi:DNA repair exonuclease SbcCD ATPase subunit